MSRRKGTPCACECDPCGSKKCIKAINNVSGDPNGDFEIKAGSGIAISQSGDNEIIIVNDAIASSFVAGDNIEINPSGDDLEIRLTDNPVINGTLQVNGDIIQQGAAYETHAEKVYTTNDYIYMRDGALAGLAAGDYAGFQVKLYDGVNDGRLVIDNTGTARVGDVGSEQPLLTRDESGSMVNGELLQWNGTGQKAVCSGVNLSQIVRGSGNIGSDTKPIKVVNGVATAVTNGLVDTTSNQVITGLKTFFNGAHQIIVKNGQMNINQRPNTYLYSELLFTDTNDSPFVKFRATMDAEGSRRLEVSIVDISGTDHWTVLASRTD